MSDSVIQVPPDSTGAKVKTYKLTTPTGADSSGANQADTVTHQQIVSIADRRGDDANLAGWQRSVLFELQAMRELLEAISLKLE